MAYRSGDYKDAANLALAALGEKDPAAMDLLGDLFREGLGVRQDDETAFGWYEKAAKLNHLPALYRVAVYAHEGYGTPPDPARGLRWLLQAGAAERPEEGFDAETVDWIAFRASEREDPHALFLLAKILQNGWGVVRDLEGAAELYAAAVTAEHPLARINLGAMRLRGEGVGEDERAALGLFEKSAELGFAIAQYDAALILSRERGPFFDKPRAKALFEKAAAQGYEPAIRRLRR